MQALEITNKIGNDPVALMELVRNPDLNRVVALDRTTYMVGFLDEARRDDYEIDFEDGTRALFSTIQSSGKILEVIRGSSTDISLEPEPQVQVPYDRPRCQEL